MNPRPAVLVLVVTIATSGCSSRLDDDDVSSDDDDAGSGGAFARGSGFGGSGPGDDRREGFRQFEGRGA